MAAIGSLVFCTDCGSLLEPSALPGISILTCHVCGAKNRDISQKVIVTRSKPDAFPSALRNKRSQVQTLSEEDMQIDAAIQKTCDRCGREEVRYYQKQLRGADEGTTIFYTCACGNKWNENN